MQCSECGKRTATLHFTQNINGQKSEVHVCDICAQKKGYIQQKEEPYSIQELLSGLFHFDPASFDLQSKEWLNQSQQLECPSCHMTFQEFQNEGKFGCASCYDTFHDRIDQIFRKVHSGNTQHNGKIPKRIGHQLHKQQEILEYRRKLEQLVKQEEFEEAAVIRDTIKQLEQKEMEDDA